MQAFNFSETYLYKIHLVANTIDKLFDQSLRRHAGTSLSQFLLLITVAHHEVINQRKVAQFLRISPAAIKRQTDLARHQGLLQIRTVGHERGQVLLLTPKGAAVIQHGLAALEKHTFGIFADHNRSTNLMGHIDLLLNQTEGALRKQQPQPLRNV